MNNFIFKEEEHQSVNKKWPYNRRIMFLFFFPDKTHGSKLVIFQTRDGNILFALKIPKIVYGCFIVLKFNCEQIANKTSRP